MQREREGEQTDRQTDKDNYLLINRTSGVVVWTLSCLNNLTANVVKMSFYKIMWIWCLKDSNE